MQLGPLVLCFLWMTAAAGDDELDKDAYNLLLETTTPDIQHDDVMALSDVRQYDAYPGADRLWRGLHDGAARPGGVGERDVPKKLVVTTRLEAPYMMLRTDSPFLAGNDRFEGFLADLIRIVAVNIGFEYTIRLVSDGKLGARSDYNNSWSGMLGEIHREEADIAVAPLTVTPARAQIVSFTRSFMTLRSCAVMRTPRRARKRAITTARKLSESSMTYGVLAGSLTHQYLRDSNKPLHRRMWSAIATFWPPALVHSVQEGLQRVRRQRFALITDCPIAWYLASRQPCDLTVTSPFLPHRGYALALRRGDRLLSVIDDELLRLQRSGALRRMRSRWWRSQCAPAPSRDQKFHSRVTLPAVKDVSPWQSATVTGYSGRDVSGSHSDVSRGHSNSQTAISLTIILYTLWL